MPRTPWDRVLKYDVRGKMQLRWDLWITEYFVRLGLPWSLLDHPAHKEFWGKENPKYHCKHSTTFSRAKLPLLYKQVKQGVDSKIKKDVKFTTGIAFTSDYWSSRAMDPYLGVTMHMIGKNWTLDRYMVHCGPHEGRHTGQLVARKLDEIINSLDLSEENLFKSMTTDNASNMKIACRDSHTIDKHISCFDHSLNLVVNAGINSVDEIKASAEKFRKLVTSCHKSNLYCERIKRACTDLNSSASTTEPGNLNLS